MSVLKCSIELHFKVGVGYIFCDVPNFSNSQSLFLLGCDLSFPANKLVSGDHCKIVQDESSGLVWLEDMRYGFSLQYVT